MPKRVAAPKVLSMKFYCFRLGSEIEIPMEDLYFTGDFDPCGRYESDVYVEFDCPCKKKHKIEVSI